MTTGPSSWGSCTAHRNPESQAIWLAAGTWISVESYAYSSIKKKISWLSELGAHHVKLRMQIQTFECRLILPIIYFKKNYHGWTILLYNFILWKRIWLWRYFISTTAIMFFVFHFFLVPKTTMVGYMFTFFYCSSFPISDVTCPSTFLTYSISGKS